MERHWWANIAVLASPIFNLFPANGEKSNAPHTCFGIGLTEGFQNLDFNLSMSKWGYSDIFNNKTPCVKSGTLLQKTEN